MAIPHSWSVHLLIDLLVADSVMELRSSDYHEQTGCLFVFHASARCGLESVSTGHVKVDTYMHSNLQMPSLKQIGTSLCELFGQNEKTDYLEAEVVQRTEERN